MIGSPTRVSQLAGELTSAGPYRLAERLGEGGMGVVYRAVDPLFRRSLAVKVMKPGLSDGRFMVDPIV